MIPDQQIRRKWNYLTIDGANIDNILFDKSAEVTENPKGQEALRTELEATVEEAMVALQSLRDGDSSSRSDT